jgi:hypothetical protein
MKKTYLPLLLLSASLSGHVKQPIERLDDEKNKSIMFTENAGQVQDQNGVHRADIYFSGHDKGLSFFLRNNGVSYQITKVSGENKKGAGSLHREVKKLSDKVVTHSVYRLDITWLACNEHASIIKDKAVNEVTNFYNTVNGKEVPGVRSYEGTWYHTIYEKTNLHYYTSKGSLKYDFVVHPGGDYRQIRFSVEGAEKIILLADGSLILRTPFGDDMKERPKCFRMEN